MDHLRYNKKLGLTLIALIIAGSTAAAVSTFASSRGTVRVNVYDADNKHLFSSPIRIQGNGNCNGKKLGKYGKSFLANRDIRCTAGKYLIGSKLGGPIKAQEVTIKPNKKHQVILRGYTPSSAPSYEDPYQVAPGSNYSY